MAKRRMCTYKATNMSVIYDLDKANVQSKA